MGNHEIIYYMYKKTIEKTEFFTLNIVIFLEFGVFCNISHILFTGHKIVGSPFSIFYYQLKRVNY